MYKGAGLQGAQPVASRSDERRPNITSQVRRVQHQWMIHKPAFNGALPKVVVWQSTAYQRRYGEPISIASGSITACMQASAYTLPHDWCGHSQSTDLHPALGGHPCLRPPMPPRQCSGSAPSSHALRTDTHLSQHAVPVPICCPAGHPHHQHKRPLVSVQQQLRQCACLTHQRRHSPPPPCKHRPTLQAARIPRLCR